MTQNKHVSVTLDFVILDEDRLLQLAKDAIEAHGCGHEFDPTNLADCVVELLLFSNPDIRSFDEYGLELHETFIRNPKEN